MDADRDGRCGEGEPGVAGARIVGEGGQVALADGAGRFHLLEVPARLVLTDRVAYGGHAVAVEGLGASRAFEVAPLGAARVDLAVRAPAPATAPALEASGGAGGPPERAPDGRLRWDHAGRTAPGAVVAADGARATAAADGTFAVPVLLAPGENRFAVTVSAGGGAAVFAWAVFLVPRPSAALVVPQPPERLAELRIAPGAGGALAVGRAAPGRHVRAGGVLVTPGPDGTFAAWVPAGDGSLEILDGAGRVLSAGPLPAGGGRLRAAAALAEVEVAFGGGDPIVTARGAGALRASLGAVEVEAGLDVDDRDREAELADLVRPRSATAVEHALDPARTLATPGDEGAADDRNPGRGRLWARVEAPGARLDLGAARARLGGELGRYDRALFGGRAALARDVGPARLEASAFGATLRGDAAGFAPPVPAHDVLGATGGAALWLAHGAIVPGSEALRMEWRDPLTGRLAAERPLVRGVDYEIDWIGGVVVLAAPLASVAGSPALVTADPFAAPRAAVVADYLRAAAGDDAEDLLGGRAGAGVGPLSIDARAAEEDRAGSRYRLLATSAELDLGPLLRVRAELARSRGALFARGGSGGFSRSVDGGWTFGGAGAATGEADAVHVEARGAAGPVAVEGWWRERGAGYSDAEFQDALAARERGASLSAFRGALSGTVLYAERVGVDPEDPFGVRPLEQRALVARAGWTGPRLGLVLEGARIERDAPQPAEELSAGARARWRVHPALALELSHHQGLETAGAARDPTFTAAGATWSRGRGSLAVRGGWGPELGPRVVVSGERSGDGDTIYGTFTADPDAPDVLSGGAAASAVGARRREGPVEAFVEDQLARDAFGLRTARVFGLSVAPRSGLRLSLSGERGERLRDDGSRAARGAAAGTASIVLGGVRLAARGELRTEGSDAQSAGGASAEWLASPGVALALRGSWLEGTVLGRDALAADVTLSGAMRRDAASVLASVSRLVEMRPGAARRDGVVARLAGTAAASRRLELGLGAALALQEIAGARDDRIAGSVRARVRVAGPADVAAEYARRAPLRGGDLGALDALRAEAGLSVRESRLAVGYTLVGFAGDGLAPAEDTGRFFVRAQLAY
ncbi:MAG TPA: hypothetical protein VFL83_22260 [Anaeromyxobacter sp.]|nr:hypothetical protein [Anaeromyxobacter sp.]